MAAEDASRKRERWVPTAPGIAGSAAETAG